MDNILILRNMRMDSLQSKPALARPNTTSIRTTIPEGIVVFLGLDLTDTLDWKMEVINGERVAMLKKSKSAKPKR